MRPFLAYSCLRIPAEDGSDPIVLGGITEDEAPVALLGALGGEGLVELVEAS
jgi:hypothetical protein